MVLEQSRGELKLLERLQTEGLMKDFLFQEPIVLPTIPDLQSPKHKIAVYLDGPPHLKSHAMERDEFWRGILKLMKWTVLEFPYKPPLSDEHSRVIAESIREALPQ